LHKESHIFTFTGSKIVPGAMIEEHFEENGFHYNVKFSLSEEYFDFSIRHNKISHKSLYKYYRLEGNSIKALQNNYLFASHPYFQYQI